MRELVMVIILACLFALLVMQVVQNIALCFGEEEEVKSEDERF